jgi:cytochrome c-type biogenesis protein CcmE
MGAGGAFVADEVLAKHDEKYMPPEVAASLKQKAAAGAAAGEPAVGGGPAAGAPAAGGPATGAPAAVGQAAAGSTT